jgi:anaerobic magnesium-protoporphyrin IX monomethyl ester cyclase
MKITLITPTPPDISAFGVRSLSSFLKIHGHQVKLLFLPGGIDRLSVDGTFVYRYPAEMIAGILALAGDSDLIGLSFMTQYFDRARQITEAIRRQFNGPIVWGGFHPTLNPEESMIHADYVVEGEGEFPLLRLVQFLGGERPWEDVPNTWRKNGERLEPPVNFHWMEEIDSLPPIDFSLDDHYVIDDRSGGIVPLTPDLFARILPKMPYFKGRFLTVYRTMTTRGCPHQCSYCFNRTLRKRYCQGTYLRRRSAGKVIEELKEITTRLSCVEGIHFFDDSFFSNSLRALSEFAERYKSEIGLPFYCQGSPESISPVKLELLIGAGMVFCEMGIQTGSESIARLYRRSASNEQILTAIGAMDGYRDRLLPPHYHVIVDNPWETVEDTRETLEILLRIPHRFMLCLASLTLFPGTELNEKAMAEGLIHDPIKDVYRKAFYRPRVTYLNVLITLTDHPLIPRRVLHWLAAPRLVALFQRESLSPLWRLALATDQIFRYAGKAIQSIRYGNFWRISQFVRKIK